MVTEEQSKLIIEQFKKVKAIDNQIRSLIAERDKVMNDLCIQYGQTSIYGLWEHTEKTL